MLHKTVKSAAAILKQGLFIKVNENRLIPKVRAGSHNRSSQGHYHKTLCLCKTGTITLIGQYVTPWNLDYHTDFVTCTCQDWPIGTSGLDRLTFDQFSMESLIRFLGGSCSSATKMQPVF